MTCMLMFPVLCIYPSSSHDKSANTRNRQWQKFRTQKRLKNRLFGSIQCHHLSFAVSRFRATKHSIWGGKKGTTRRQFLAIRSWPSSSKSVEIRRLPFQPDTRPLPTTSAKFNKPFRAALSLAIPQNDGLITLIPQA
ncbi:Protein of unknown function [Pyronema omphalodes CBS 100304]|uniref:Uncharacterized protein n=1 Tax=Pyronema omphalodes (strain CBS 100304) TaxID=1076935 RepID=U4KTU0_PYROM|nr:Protein of unknown function [Pyronema omphalodes CBS 100304]